MEEFKEIEGFENYLIYKDGRIFSKKSNKFLKTFLGTDGRNHIKLSKDGKKHDKRVYRLLATAFIPNPDNLPQVNHIDGNCSNDDLDNLEWCSNSYNTQEAYNNGLYRSKNRVGVFVIKKDSGFILGDIDSLRECERITGIGRHSIANILNGRKKTNNYDFIFWYLD